MKNSRNGNDQQRCFPLSCMSALLMLAALMLLALKDYGMETCNKLHKYPHCLAGDSNSNNCSNRSCASVTEISIANIINGSKSSNNGNIGDNGSAQCANMAAWKIKRLFGLKSSKDNSKPKEEAINRGKRFLTFSGAGVVKFVFGLTFPIQLVSKKRSLAMFYNFQAQYTPPPRPIYWWSFYNSSTFPLHRRQRTYQLSSVQREASRLHGLTTDGARAFIYTLVEHLLERDMPSGSECLLQAICETSQTPYDQDGNILHAMLNAILIPTLPNVATKYMDAQHAGQFGADCESTYDKCPQNRKWLINLKKF